MHQSSIDKMKYFRDKYLNAFANSSLSVADIGSQNVNGTYRPLFENPNWTYTGIDVLPGANVDVVLESAYEWKNVESEKFDVVISGQTLEHVEFFWLTLLEISRILKKGGVCCIIVPGAGPEHRFPVDCWRFFPDGLRAMAKYAKWEILEVTTVWKNNDAAGEKWKDSLLVARKPVA